MDKKEIRKKITELIAKRKAMLEKIDGAKDSGELDAIENELRKLNMQIDGYKAQLDEAEPDKDDEGNDPAWRKVEDEPETRSLTPLNGVVKAGGKGADVRTGDDTPDMQYRKAFMEFILRKKPIPAELRADQVTMTSDVSAVIPTHLVNKIVEEIKNIGMIMPRINITHFQGGVQIPISSVRPVASWVEEGKSPDKQKKKVDEYIQFTWHKLKCVISMTLETSVVTLESFESTFIRQVLEAMQEALETSVIKGTGEGQPKGILKGTPPDGQALIFPAPSYKLITEAEGALPEKYEKNAEWCMTKKTFMSFIGMTDANGQPIARVDSGFNGKPERFLLGRPVLLTDYIDSYSSSIEDGTIYAFIFNFEDYDMNINLNMKTKLYEDDDTDDINYKAVMLADGKVVRVNSLVTIAMGTGTAAKSKSAKSSLTGE